MRTWSGSGNAEPPQASGIDIRNTPVDLRCISSTRSRGSWRASATSAPRASRSGSSASTRRPIWAPSSATTCRLSAVISDLHTCCAPPERRNARRHPDTSARTLRANPQMHVGTPTPEHHDPPRPVSPGPDGADRSAIRHDHQAAQHDELLPDECHPARSDCPDSAEHVGSDTGTGIPRDCGAPCPRKSGATGRRRVSFGRRRGRIAERGWNGRCAFDEHDAARHHAVEASAR